MRLFCLVGFLVLLGATSAPGQKKARLAVVVDSKMTRSQALGKNSFPPKVLAQMAVVDVTYLGFDGKEHRGQIVVDKDIVSEVRQIFAELRKAHYPIKKVIPIVKYGWHDQKSINDNNTSAFNYRRVIVPGGGQGSLSKHSFGRAIDLNPYQNPFVSANGRTPRPYNPKAKGTLTRQSRATQVFYAHGWKWGGDWTGGKDYQHFYKP